MPTPSSCPAAIPSFTPAGLRPIPPFSSGLAGRQKAPDLWRMRRLHGAGRGADRRKMATATPWPASCRSPPASPARKLQPRLSPICGRFPAPRGTDPCAAMSFTIRPSPTEGTAERLFAASDAAGNDLGAIGLRRGKVMGSYAHVIARRHDGPRHHADGHRFRCRQVADRRRTVPRLCQSRPEGACRSSRRTCRTTPPSPSMAARSAAPRRCRRAPRGSIRRVHMNPVLLKPETERGAQVIVQGQRATPP